MNFSDSDKYKETVKFADNLFLKKSKKPIINPIAKSKDPIKSREISENQSKESLIQPIDETPILLEKGLLVCNFDFACIFSRLIQKLASNSVI